MASRLVRAGSVVIVAAVSPYRQARLDARRLIEEFGLFLEVHVDASLEACAARDTKGLYARARRGELAGLTGFDDPCEAPLDPFARIGTDATTPEKSLAALLTAMEAISSASSRRRATPTQRARPIGKARRGEQAPTDTGPPA